MKLKLEIDCNNDAFLCAYELSTLLHDVGCTIEDSEQQFHQRTFIRDINGNTVGWWEVN